MTYLLDNGGVYVLTLIFGACLGTHLADAERTATIIANTGMIVSFVALAVATSASWPWMIPVFLAANIGSAVFSSCPPTPPPHARRRRVLAQSSHVGSTLQATIRSQYRTVGQA